MPEAPITLGETYRLSLKHETRIQILEVGQSQINQQIIAHQISIDHMAKGIDAINANTKKLVWLVVIAVVSGLLQMLFKFGS